MYPSKALYGLVKFVYWSIGQETHKDDKGKECSKV